MKKQMLFQINLFHLFAIAGISIFYDIDGIRLYGSMIWFVFLVWCAILLLHIQVALMPSDEGTKEPANSRYLMLAIHILMLLLDLRFINNEICYRLRFYEMVSDEVSHIFFVVVAAARCYFSYFVYRKERG